ncbi:H-NS family histone-like protein [Nostoc sp. 'Peltigera membranacea cyanobiont' 210A]|uniref:H-NS family histone-like protein n=1 Tax=Nostoc sp. 'Peltigera membranacea cyanobiont' 210A TaxID=2014529 RepID=UPI0026A9705D
MKKVKTIEIKDLQPQIEELDDSKLLGVVGGSEALKTINNIRTLRAQARETTLDTLEEILGKLEIVVNERQEQN